MFKKIAPDKKRHFYVGIIIGIIIQICAMYILPFALVWLIVISLVGVSAIAYGFELISLWTGKGHHEINDAIATIIGGIIGIGIGVLVMGFKCM